MDDLPELEMEMLWYSDYWDGPLDGICLVEDRLCWFSIVGDIYEDVRNYYIYELTDEELREEMTIHFMFETLVGLHTCRHVSRVAGQQIYAVSGDEVKPFYDWYKNRPKRDYVKNKEPIGIIKYD